MIILQETLNKLVKSAPKLQTSFGIFPKNADEVRTYYQTIGFVKQLLSDEKLRVSAEVDPTPTAPQL